MKQPRLALLFAVLAALLVLRWWDGSGSDRSIAVSEAAVRSATVAARSSTAKVEAKLAVARSRDIDLVEPRNAFAVRVPPAPPPPPPPPPPVRVATVVAPVVVAPAPVVEAPPPPPPLQVIGTWDDGQGASVFLAGPRGTLQARVGDAPLAEYRIAQITPQQVVLRHLASNRDVVLTVPSAIGRLLK